MTFFNYALSEAQQAALELLGEESEGDHFYGVYGGKTGLGHVNKRAAQSLIDMGLAKWLDEDSIGSYVQITDAGREKLKGHT